MASESDPRRNTANIKEILSGTVTHLREDVGKVDDPRAQALFETAAEVLGVLIKAFEHRRWTETNRGRPT